MAAAAATVHQPNASADKRGATTAPSVSANTDLLITGADRRRQLTHQSRKLGIEIVDHCVIWQKLIAAVT